MVWDLGVCNDLFGMGAGAVFRLGQADVYLVAMAQVAHLPRLFPTIYCLESSRGLDKSDVAVDGRVDGELPHMMSLIILGYF